MSEKGSLHWAGWNEQARAYLPYDALTGFAPITLPNGTIAVPVREPHCPFCHDSKMLGYSVNAPTPCPFCSTVKQWVV